VALSEEELDSLFSSPVEESLPPAALSTPFQGRMSDKDLDALFERPEDQPDSMFEAFSFGLERTWNALSTTVATYDEDAGEVERLAGEAGDIAKTRQQEAFMAQIASSESEGFFDSLSNVSVAAVDNKEGALHEMIAQTPNMAAALAGGLTLGKAGMVLGAAAGPAGSALGGAAGMILGTTGFFLGMAMGNASIETGFIAQEKAGAIGEITKEAMAEARTQGAIKGGVIAAVDTLTLGINKWLMGAPGRAVEKAISKSLVAQGVDIADKAALTAAFSNKMILKDVVDVGVKAAEKSLSLGNRGLRGGTAFTLETLSEGAGEGLGSLAAGLDVSYTDMILESFLAAPMSATELWVAKKLAGSEGNIPGQGRITGFVVDGNGSPPPGGSPPSTSGGSIREAMGLPPLGDQLVEEVTAEYEANKTTINLMDVVDSVMGQTGSVDAAIDVGQQILAKQKADVIDTTLTEELSRQEIQKEAEMQEIYDISKEKVALSEAAAQDEANDTSVTKPAGSFGATAAPETAMGIALREAQEFEFAKINKARLDAGLAEYSKPPGDLTSDSEALAESDEYADDAEAMAAGEKERIAGSLNESKQAQEAGYPADEADGVPAEPKIESKLTEEEFKVRVAKLGEELEQSPDKVSFGDFLIAQGGVRDDNGEMKSRDLDLVQTNDNGETLFSGMKLMRDDGISMEEAVERGVEAGYIPEDALGMDGMIGPEILEIIEKEIAGVPTYPSSSEIIPNDVASSYDSAASELRNITITRGKERISKKSAWNVLAKEWAEGKSISGRKQKEIIEHLKEFSDFDRNALQEEVDRYPYDPNEYNDFRDTLEAEDQATFDAAMVDNEFESILESADTLEEVEQWIEQDERGTVETENQSGPEGESQAALHPGLEGVDISQAVVSDAFIARSEFLEETRDALLEDGGREIQYKENRAIILVTEIKQRERIARVLSECLLT
jgi:hypothetical protein